MNKVVEGPPYPVLVITDEQLAENGGKYKLLGGSILRVVLVGYEEKEERGGISLDPLLPIYVVNDKPNFRLYSSLPVEAGSALPVYQVVGVESEETLAIPVYIAGGSLISDDPLPEPLNHYMLDFTKPENAINLRLFLMR